MTRRTARGTGTPPVQGALLLPDQVDSTEVDGHRTRVLFHPPVRCREVVGWLVVDEPNVATVAKLRWNMKVLGVARRD